MSASLGTATAQRSGDDSLLVTSAMSMSKQLDQMKLPSFILTIVGLAGCTLATLAQTNPPAGQASAATAVSATAVPVEAGAVPAPSAAGPGEATAPAPAKAVAPGGTIPLIVMEDVPLTDAIRNLARQAALNYLLDPKIGYGQAGPDGKPAPQPSVSIRWENITAEQALTALLNNYSLQMIEDPKSRIARVTAKRPGCARTAGHPDHSTQVCQPLQYRRQRPGRLHRQAEQGAAGLPDEPIGRRRHGKGDSRGAGTHRSLGHQDQASAHRGAPAGNGDESDQFKRH